MKNIMDNTSTISDWFVLEGINYDYFTEQLISKVNKLNCIDKETLLLHIVNNIKDVSEACYFVIRHPEVKPKVFNNLMPLCDKLYHFECMLGTYPHNAKDIYLFMYFNYCRTTIRCLDTSRLFIDHKDELLDKAINLIQNINDVKSILIRYNNYTSVLFERALSLCKTLDDYKSLFMIYPHIKNKLFNRLIKLCKTFNDWVYLVHMYPHMKEELFTKIILSCETIVQVKKLIQIYPHKKTDIESLQLAILL